jgi:hypothetical protein
MTVPASATVLPSVRRRKTRRWSPTTPARHRQAVEEGHLRHRDQRNCRHRFWASSCRAECRERTRTTRGQGSSLRPLSSKWRSAYDLLVPQRRRFPDNRPAFGREHEESLVRFVKPLDRRRFKEILRKVAAGHPRGNVPRNARYALNHFPWWDSRYVTEYFSMVPDEVERTLRAREAPKSCWVLSERPEFDGVEMALRDAVEGLVGGGSCEASVISCLPGRLAYFLDDDEGTYLILERAASE